MSKVRVRPYVHICLIQNLFGMVKKKANDISKKNQMIFSIPNSIRSVEARYLKSRDLSQNVQNGLIHEILDSINSNDSGIEILLSFDYSEQFFICKSRKHLHISDPRSPNSIGWMKAEISRHKPFSKFVA